jgi:hypothetical protein
MKRWLVLAVAAIAIAGFSTVSFAAIQGSHHDMAAYTGLANKDACYACHGIKAETSTIASLGQVGNLCYLRCHVGSGSAGTTIQRLASAVPEYGFFDNGTRTVVPQTYTPAASDKYGAGHLFIAGATNVPAPDTQAMVTATAWPYVGDANLQCTSCHDVHSNEYTPFVRAPLSDNANQANAFCQKCHGASADGAARWVTITGNPNGSHPSEVDFAGAATRTVGGRAGRTILFKDVFTAADNNAVFRNVSAWGTALNPRGAMYNPGGKLGAPQGAVQTSSTVGVVGCYTCHATHIPPTGLTPDRGQLLVAPYKGRYQSDLCIGCHGGNAANSGVGLTVANPGVTNYYHPVDADSRPIDNSIATQTVWQVSTGAFNITVNLDNAGVLAPLGLGNRLICASCHTGSTAARPLAGVHYGPAGTMLLNPRKPTCESCHNTTVVNTGLTANSHHVYGGGTTAGSRFTGYGYPTSIQYNATFTANLADGLQCNDCHVFNNTAHNWN